MCVITKTPGSTEGPSLHLLDSVWANMSVTRNRISCFIMAISCSISCSLRLEQRLIPHAVRGTADHVDLFRTADHVDLAGTADHVTELKQL
jgi:hypothetical protein